MEANLIVSSYLITQKDIDQLNRQTEKYYFSLSTRVGYAPIYDEVIYVIIEMLKNLGYNATYDLIKAAIISLISKIKLKKHTTTRMSIIVDNKKSEIFLPFEVSDDQKDKLVDAAIEKLLK